MKRLTSVFVFLQLCLFQVGVFAQEMQEYSDMPPSRDQGFWQTMIMVSIALMFFYFILWRPEQKRRQEVENHRASLKQGDSVIAMGILGTVVRVNEDTVIVKMYDGAKLEFLKDAITGMGHDSAEKSSG